MLARSYLKRKEGRDGGFESNRNGPREEAASIPQRPLQPVSRKHTAEAQQSLYLSVN